MGEINIFGVSYCDLLSCLPFSWTYCSMYLSSWILFLCAVGSWKYPLHNLIVIMMRLWRRVHLICTTVYFCTHVFCYTPNTGRNSIVTGIWLYPANLPFGVPMMLLKCSNSMPLYTLDLSPHSLILPALPMSLCVCVVPLTFSNTISHSIWSLISPPAPSAFSWNKNWELIVDCKCTQEIRSDHEEESFAVVVGTSICCAGSDGGHGYGSSKQRVTCSSNSEELDSEHGDCSYSQQSKWQSRRAATYRVDRLQYWQH